MQLATSVTWSRMSTHIAWMPNGLTRENFSRFFVDEVCRWSTIICWGLVVAEHLASFLIGPLFLDQSSYLCDHRLMCMLYTGVYSKALSSSVSGKTYEDANFFLFVIDFRKWASVRNTEEESKHHQESLSTFLWGFLELRNPPVVHVHIIATLTWNIREKKEQDDTSRTTTSKHIQSRRIARISIKETQVE